MANVDFTVPLDGCLTGIMDWESGKFTIVTTQGEKTVTGLLSDVLGIFPNEAAIIRLVGGHPRRAERRVGRLMTLETPARPDHQTAFKRRAGLTPLRGGLQHTPQWL